jgi:nucleoside-diphosphate-sugar epimerase
MRKRVTGHWLRYATLRYASASAQRSARQDPRGEAGVAVIFCGSLLDRQRPVIYGDCEQTRDCAYVKDVARANLLARKFLREAGESTESVKSIRPIDGKVCRRARLDNSTTR